MKTQHNIGKIGFYVSKHSYFRDFLEIQPDIESGRYTLLKEWEIWERARTREADIDLLSSYEKKFEIPSLLEAIICDRRLTWGKLFSIQQDYKPRYSYKQVLSFLQETILSVEQFFNEVKPDVVVSFIGVTLGEYISYLFAKTRNIPYLNLRPTRIKNYMTFGESITEPSSLIIESYKKYCTMQTQDDWTKEAKEFVKFVRLKHGRYEGSVLPSRQPSYKTIASKKQPLQKRIYSLLKSEYEYRFIDPQFDSTFPGSVIPLLMKNLVIPCRVYYNNWKYNKAYVVEKELKNMKYAFFPLHTEPEVTLLVYSRAYLNQIEVIRNIANNLPIDMTLIVKEHPHSVGKRSSSYYDKITNISNVRLADPSLESKVLITNSKIVCTIAGSVGFESIILKKPVITFGQTPFEILPNEMIQKITNIDKLGLVISNILNSHKNNDKALVSYIAAVIRNSVPIDYYSKALEKEGAFSESDTKVHSNNLYELLADYTLKQYNDLSQT